MAKHLIALRHGLAAAALSTLAFHANPAHAQQGGNNAYFVTATPAAFLTRYYAPYALQAAAAYDSSKDLDAAVQGPPGSDVDFVLRNFPDEDQSRTNAKAYLKPWRYQFGSEGYVDCFDPSDADCKAATQGWSFTASRWLAFGRGPSFHVWARTDAQRSDHVACREVSIAFRGTEQSAGDWVANLDPITNYVADDHYVQLRRNIDAIIKRITTLDCYRRAKRPQIVSVGHSLGGGLAQFAALSNNPARPRIVKVFAFDSSPVTGSSLVDRRVLAQNAQGLEVDRIYQKGEVLERLRRVYQQFPPSSSRCDPYVRTVVFDALQPAGSVQLHSMAGLARQVVQFSHSSGQQVPYLIPLKNDRCNTLYRAPASDVDEPSPAEAVVASATGAAAVRFARANRNRLPAGGVEAGPFAMGFWQPPQAIEPDAAPTRLKTGRSAKASGSKRIHNQQAREAHAEADAMPLQFQLSADLTAAATPDYQVRRFEPN